MVMVPTCTTYLGFVFLCVASAHRMQRAPLLWILGVLIGELSFLLPVILKLKGSESLGILLLPQFAVTGWLVRRLSAFIFPAIASSGMLAVAFYAHIYHPTDTSML